MPLRAAEGAAALTAYISAVPYYAQSRGINSNKYDPYGAVPACFQLLGERQHAKHMRDHHDPCSHSHGELKGPPANLIPWLDYNDCSESRNANTALETAAAALEGLDDSFTGLQMTPSKMKRSATVGGFEHQIPTVSSIGDFVPIRRQVIQEEVPFAPGRGLSKSGFETQRNVAYGDASGKIFSIGPTSDNEAEYESEGEISSLSLHELNGKFCTRKGQRGR